MRFLYWDVNLKAKIKQIHSPIWAYLAVCPNCNGTGFKFEKGHLIGKCPKCKGKQLVQVVKKY